MRASARSFACSAVVSDAPDGIGAQLLDIAIAPHLSRALSPFATLRCFALGDGTPDSRRIGYITVASISCRRDNPCSDFVVTIPTFAMRDGRPWKEHSIASCFGFCLQLSYFWVYRP